MPNIMVVEDSPTMRQLITFTLKRVPGYNVVEAVDGMDALKKLSVESFDLILADINMPVMDGLKLVGLLRNDNRYKKTPIIMITTESTEEDRKKAMAVGATAYLSKPIQTQDLLKVVQEFLGDVGCPELTAGSRNVTAFAFSYYSGYACGSQNFLKE